MAVGAAEVALIAIKAKRGKTSFLLGKGHFQQTAGPVT